MRINLSIRAWSLHPWATLHTFDLQITYTCKRPAAGLSLTSGSERLCCVDCVVQNLLLYRSCCMRNIFLILLSVLTALYRPCCTRNIFLILLCVLTVKTCAVISLFVFISTGAFYPGVPVQPVCLLYLNRLVSIVCLLYPNRLVSIACPPHWIQTHLCSAGLMFLFVLFFVA